MSAKVKILERKGISYNERLFLIEVFKGMRVTLGHFLRNFLDTSKLYVRHYPEVKPEIGPRWRGRHRLTTHDDGTVKCVACFMCQTNCPSHCIMIEAGERLDGRSEKLPIRFDIDLSECIYCGYCVEACPMDAIRMDTGIYSVTGSERQGMLKTLDELLATPGAFTEEEYRKEAFDIMIAQWLFFGFATLAVLGALGLILFRHPMNGAMCFIVTLISLAGLYALLSASLLFALQLIVYAGAIMSLILFIIMFLNIQISDLPEEKGRWTFFFGGIVLIAPIALFLLKIVKTIPESGTSIIGQDFGGVKKVGLVLFRDWLLPFEIVSILLLVALVGAVVLAGKKEMAS